MTDRSVVVHDYKYEPSDYSDDRSSAAHGDAYRDDDDDYSDDYADQDHRGSHFSNTGQEKENAVEILMRLAESLGQEDAGDYSLEDSSDSQRLKHKGAGSDAFHSELLDSYPSSHGGLKKGGYRKRRSRVADDEEDESEDENDEGKLLEYRALAFDHDPEMGTFDAEANTTAFPLPLEAHANKDPNFKFYDKKWKVNWYGSAIVMLYCIALVFYLYIRITKTMGLGGYIGYGAFVLFVEIMGATTTLLYGVNLLLNPVYDEIPKDPEFPTLPVMRNSYHIRVLVPCYKESLELIQRTVTHALDATLPADCFRTVYLCDDGKDPQKRKWCQRMGAGVQYISGRTRAQGEMNGKSANLNNCLEQIYPADKVIPHNELVCIFDADQLANTDFYLRTVPLFDGGDDVGMVLSPQAFHNLSVHADIFNHANIHFWEYSQPGYDALGFISCTGTNFLCRSTALRESGWSPTYTLTEDFALGMIMKANKWHCCYVNDYLAVGEAPDQIRNCFQQRSRWCKGHFQVVLSRKHCPLFHKGLGFGHRIMYCSGVWAYIVGALTTPTFMIIPLLTIWAGIFPIVISWWAALALTVYFLAQSAVLGYSKQFKHVESLWFANIANNILWFTFVKGCFRSMTSLFGKTITFKTTLKGVNKLADSAFGDLWMPCLSFLLLAISLGFGLVNLLNGPTVITTLAISVVWIVYGMIPPYLLIHYALIGRGSTLSFMCKVMFLLHYACGIIAIVLLWAVYPKDFDFGLATKYSLNFFEAQRVGDLPTDNRIPWRADSLLYEGSDKFGTLDLTGGWMTGAELGTVKLTMATAYVTTMLAWGVLAFPSGYKKSGQQGWAQQEVNWGADYLMKCISKNDSDATLIYQVGNLTLDYTSGLVPENMTDSDPGAPTYMPRSVYAISTKDGTSDLSGQMVAALASSAIVQARFNSSGSGNGSRYTDLMDNAKFLYGTAKQNRGRYTADYTYDCVSPYAKSLIGSTTKADACVPRTSYRLGSALAIMNSTSYYDDLIWAAAWMYYATGDQTYKNDASEFFALYLNQAGANPTYLTSYDNVFYAANILLANLTGIDAFHRQSKEMLKQWVCGQNGQVKFTLRGRACNLADMSTGATQTASFLSLLYGIQSDSQHASADQKQRYICFTRTQTRYVLGDVGRSLMVGFGKKYPTHVQSREALGCDGINSCTNDRGLSVDAPNPHILYGAVPYFNKYSDDFPDVRSQNESRIDIVNNAAFAGTAAGLIDAPGTWEQCLQGYGVLSKDTSVCNNN